ncbi:MAG: hypothetical protein JXA99_12840 [Candidatus Lokiarchaeota archaeon]|nr:hypothetical protein [Candidatus Lokiarchaeota archaeon]
MLIFKKKIFALGMILISFFSFSRVNNILANPAMPNYDSTGTIGPFPITNNNCTIKNATILYKVYCSDRHDYSLTIDANYTIYNPNSTLEATILAPFPDSVMCDLISVYSDNPFQALDYEIKYDWDYPEYDQYLSVVYSMILKSNITLPENNTFKLCYYIDYSYIFLSANREEIFYWLYTADSWNEISYERIEYQVYGLQPDYFSDNEYMEIINHTNYISYIWTWNNQSIDVNSVYIGYGSNRGIGTDTLLSYLLIIQTGIFSIVIKTIINKKKKKGVRICTN